MNTDDTNDTNKTDQDSTSNLSSTDNQPDVDLSFPAVQPSQSTKSPSIDPSSISDPQTKDPVSNNQKNPPDPIQPTDSSADPFSITDNTTTTTNTDQSEEPNNQQQVENPQQVVASPHAPKKYGGGKVIATIFGVLLLIGGVTAGVVLVQRQQLIEQQAVSGKECEQSDQCLLLDNPGNQGSYTAPNTIDYIKIGAGQNLFQFGQGTNNDGCYEVTVQQSTVSWNRVGSGSSCKDISNIQVWISKSTSLEWNINQICYGIQVGVSGNHGEFKVVIESSDDQSNWQNKERQVQAAGEANTYTFMYQIPRPAGSYIRVQIGLMESSQFVKEYIGKVIDCGEPTETPITPTEQTGTLSAICDEVLIYDSNWNKLSAVDLANLDAGDSIYLTVSGSATQGTIQQAKFTVNGTERNPVTSKNSAGAFYDQYTIPANTKNFTINAKLYHSQFGWF